MLDTQQLTWLGKPAADRRTLVLAAAQSVFGEQGYYQAEVQTIASMTRIGKATVYKIFTSKEGILEAMMREAVEHLGTLVLGKLVGDEPPMIRIRNAALAMLGFVEDNRHLAWVLLRDAGPSLKLTNATYEQFMCTIEQVMGPVLASERERGLHLDKSDRQVLEIAMSLLIGLAYKWLLVQGKPGDLLEEGRTVIDAMLAGENKKGTAEAVP